MTEKDGTHDMELPDDALADLRSLAETRGLSEEEALLEAMHHLYLAIVRLRQEFKFWVIYPGNPVPQVYQVPEGANRGEEVSLDQVSPAVHQWIARNATK